MFKWRKALVYCSKDKADWEKAQGLLDGNGIGMKAWHVEEPPMAGCGVKIDPRTFLNKNPVPKILYKIEVAFADKTQAEGVLSGQVQPVRYYGFMG